MDYLYIVAGFVLLISPEIVKLVQEIVKNE